MKICKFIEGSFMPSFDGASQKFEHITKELSSISNLTVIHCYRGWSDLKQIERQNFRTYAIPPKYYYYDYSIIDKTISLLKPDIIEMNDPELLISTGLHLNNKFKIPLVYDAHFVSSILVKDITKNNSASSYEELIEKKIGEIVSGATCFTEIDKNDLLVSTNLEPKRVKVIPFGIDFDGIEYKKVSKKDNAILFLGNMFFQPNQDAVKTIVKKIAPLVFQKNRDLVFKFVGDVPKNLVNTYKNKNIIFEGRIKDYKEVFDNVFVCLAPVRVGGGIRVKLLTYTASGIPIISTKVAASGIEFDNYINMAETPEEFANKILETHANEAKYFEKSKIAYESARLNHSWKNIAYKNLDFYNEVVKMPVYSSLMPQVVKSEPYWLEETIKKGRFSNKYFNNKAMYVLGCNKRRRVILD